MTNSRRLVFPALIAAGILWGTTVPLSKLALGWLPPVWLAFARFALAGALLVFISRGRLRGAASPAIVFSGAVGYGGSVVLQNLGVQRTSVAHAALLIGATPVLVAILAAVTRQGLARPVAWAGFGLSLAGVAVIASGRGGGSSLAGDGLVLLAQLGSAGFTVSQPALLRGRDPVAVTAVQLMAAAAGTLPIALLSEGTHTGHASLAAVLATAGLIIGGTVGPTTLFAFALSRVSADVAGAFLNLEPLVGAILGTIVFADPLGPVQLAGGAAILVGIGLSSLDVVRGERRARAGAAASGPPDLAGASSASPAMAAAPAMSAAPAMAAATEGSAAAEWVLVPAGLDAVSVGADAVLSGADAASVGAVTSIAPASPRRIVSVHPPHPVRPVRTARGGRRSRRMHRSRPARPLPGRPEGARLPIRRARRAAARVAGAARAARMRRR
jgi:O-acetylserine/cysteine efflux transporter